MSQTQKMNQTAYNKLKRHISTWTNLVNLNDQQFLVCNYFSFKNLEELTAVCPSATKTRGQIFFRAENLSESLLAKLLTLIQEGLVELINTNCAEQITSVLTEIKNKDKDLFEDVTNSHPEITGTEQIDSLKQLIDLQISELTVLTSRYRDFKVALTATIAFDQNILTLQDLLGSLEEGNQTAFAQLDGGLDQLTINYDRANNSLLSLLSSDRNFCTFSVNHDEEFKLDKLKNVLSAVGRSSPDITQLVYKRKSGAELTVLKNQLDQLNEVSKQINLWKARNEPANDQVNVPLNPGLQAQQGESNSEGAHEQASRDQDTEGADNVLSQNSGLGPYFQGTETLDDIARLMPERYVNHNHLRPQAQGRFSSHNTSAGLYGYTSRAAPEVNKDAQKVKVFNGKLLALGNEIEGTNISTLDQATCKMLIKRLDDLKTLFTGIELLGLPTARFQGKYPETFMNEISVTLQQRLHAVNEQLHEARRFKDNALKRLPNNKLLKLGSALDYLTWAPGIAQLQEQVGVHDPSFRQAVLDSLEVAEDISYCQTLVGATEIMKYLVKKYLSIENLTAAVRKRLATLRNPEDAFGSLTNITERVKLIDTLVLNEVLFILDDS